jgi:hypothetical protein
VINIALADLLEVAIKHITLLSGLTEVEIQELLRGMVISQTKGQ